MMDRFTTVGQGGRDADSKEDWTTLEAKTKSKVARQHSEAARTTNKSSTDDMTNEAEIKTNNSANLSAVEKNNGHPDLSPVERGKGQSETLKASTAMKRAVEVVKKEQACEGKKAVAAKKRKEASEEKINRMKATLDKEVEKKKAA